MDILQNVFSVPLKKESHTGLERHEGEIDVSLFINKPLSISHSGIYLQQIRPFSGLNNCVSAGPSTIKQLYIQEHFPSHT